MGFNEELIREIEYESKSTRKLLANITEDTWKWKPHEKSMDMKQLALLVAQMFGWIPKMIQYPELDFENADAWASEAKTTDELVALLDANVKEMRDKLSAADDTTMDEEWVMRTGDTVLWKDSKRNVIRNTISHMAHHRGQLTVFARLKDITVPAIYGPSADDQNFEMQ